MIRFLFLILTLYSFNSNAQEIKIQADNLPLDKVLIELRNNYGIQTSFDHQLISNCLVSISSPYYSAEQAIKELVKSCDLNYELVDEVFIIFKNQESKIKNIDQYYFYSGQFIDDRNNEPLPFSNIETENNNFVADANGNFFFRTKNSYEKLLVSHVGYYLLDTLLSNGNNQQIKLTPSVINLQEVVVSSEAIVYNYHIGEKGGLIKINNKIASLLPGNNNNTLLNLLRLQPGILAAAEQSVDYIIRGSYPGQVLIQFDGIPLFSSSSLNNEIGIVNPLIVKDVEVFKGGHEVYKGDRIGGIINMTGNTGNPEQFNANLNLNTQTLSGIVNIPIAEKYSLQAAFRQSYSGVFDWNDISNNSNSRANQSITPDYTFSDMNIKFSQRDVNGDNFYVSLLGNKDNSSFDIYEDESRNNLSWENNIEKTQLGGAVFYNKNWDETGKTTVALSYSNLLTNSIDRIGYSDPRGGSGFNTYYTENRIEEISIKTEHQFPTFGNNTLSVGGLFTHNKAAFKEDTVSINLEDKGSASNRVSTYLKDNIVFGKALTLRPGIKLDYLSDENDFYLQSQIDVFIKPHTNWGINMAWGMYKQYITKIALVDDLGNNFYFWGISDNTDFPLVSGMHSLLEISYKLEGFIFDVEGFYKTSNGLSQYYITRESRDFSIVEGKSRAYGIDFFVKKEILKQDFWISYTLSRTEENFSEATSGEYQKAPQDQTHEIKAATIFNLSPWYFSINYVYGSGLAYSANLIQEGTVPYNRLDVAVLYRFNTEKFNLETGLSIVNLLNTDNIGYSGFSHLPGNERVYISGIPFTPSLFLNIGL
jgi:hypothetical protein